MRQSRLFVTIAGLAVIAAGCASVSPPRGASVRSEGVDPSAASVGSARAHDPVEANRLHLVSIDPRWHAAPANVSAAVFDSSTGETLVLHPKLRTYMASTVKVPVLVTALTARTRAAHAAVAAHADAMIERSDNDAATAVWTAAGGSAALQRTFDELAMKDTGSAPVLLEPWDGERSSASDLVLLMRKLVQPTPPVTTAIARRVLTLMSSVEPDQTWGVTAGVRAGDRVALKNGWVPVGHDGWTVNSMGVVQSKHHYYCLAVITSGQPSMQAGIGAVERAARAIAAQLS